MPHTMVERDDAFNRVSRAAGRGEETTVALDVGEGWWIDVSWSIGRGMSLVMTDGSKRFGVRHFNHYLYHETPEGETSHLCMRSVSFERLWSALHHLIERARRSE